MLNEARGPVTQWELNWWYYSKQNFFVVVCIYNSKPRFHQQVILQFLGHTIFNSNLIPHRNNAIVLVINNLNMSSLSDPKMSQKISDLNDMQIQYVKQTNEIQIIVRCNHAQLTIQYIFFIYKLKQVLTKLIKANIKWKWTEMSTLPPN